MKIEATLQNVPVVGEILNSIPHGIAILGTDLCILTMNRFLEAMIGHETDEVVGVYGEFVLRTSLDTKMPPCKMVLENGEPISVDGNIINRHRKKLPVHFTFTRLHDELGQPAGVLIVLEDISVITVEELGLHEQSIRTDILGHSKPMAEVFELMSVLARTDASVLITGETGTGKDLIAEALHKSSQRARQPFIKVNCGALPEALLESELFGHVKGAFTGAFTETVGMFRLANKGTIFLTEIGDLSLPLQVKLLSVLDDREFFPVGGSKKVQVDVRIIAATHRTLREEVQKGLFREDLFYRLNVLHLHIPPLRERDEDIRLLLDHFLRQFSEKLGRNVTAFTAEATEILHNYPYPGNVRELRNIAEYSANICQGNMVEIRDLPQYMFRPMEPPVIEPIVSNPSPQSLSVVERAIPPGRERGDWTSIEKEMIVKALRESGGNRTKAASILGWGRTTLWRKMKKFHLS
jgi:transcriptional regulator with PAS, ATPase and Fis domain